MIRHILVVAVAAVATAAAEMFVQSLVSHRLDLLLCMICSTVCRCFSAVYSRMLAVVLELMAVYFELLAD